MLCLYLYTQLVLHWTHFVTYMVKFSSFALMIISMNEHISLLFKGTISSRSEETSIRAWKMNTRWTQWLKVTLKTVVAYCCPKNHGEQKNHSFSWGRSELTDRNVELYPQFFLELITTQLRFHMVSPQLVYLKEPLFYLVDCVALSGRYIFFCYIVLHSAECLWNVLYQYIINIVLRNTKVLYSLV